MTCFADKALDANPRNKAARRLSGSRFIAALAWRYAYSPSAVIVRTAEAELLSTVSISEPALDLCCGDGFFSSLWRPEGFAAGCDLSAPRLESASRKGIYGRLELADIAERVPFQSDAFDTIVSNSSLEHVKEVDGALMEVARVLRPGGKLYLTVPSWYGFDWWPCGREARQRYSEFQPVHNWLSLAEWTRRLAGAGLTVEWHRYYLSKRAARIFFALDYAVSRSIMTEEFYIGRPFVKAMRKLPRWVLSVMWQRLFSSLSIASGASGGGLLVAARKAG